MKRSRLVPIACVALLLSGCGTSDVQPEPPLKPSPSPTYPATPAPEPDPPATTEPDPPAPKAGKRITVNFAGDVHFEGDLEKLLLNPERALAPLNRRLSEADFTFGNLESSLTRRGTPDPKELEDPSNRYHFRTDDRALTAMKAGGFDLLTVANNHGADYGIEGVQDTLRSQETSPIPFIGVGKDRQSAFEPHREQLRGERFSFFAADASKLESRAPTWEANTSPGLAYARGEGLAYLADRIKLERDAGATVVVYLHWGTEDESCPSPEQYKIERVLSKAGAAAIVGSHTHRLMGRGWEGETYVAYGLGNFVWYHGGIPETGLLTLTFRDGRVIRDSFAPGLIPRYGGLPRFLSGSAKSSALAVDEKLRACAGLSDKAPSPPATSTPLPSYSSSVESVDEALAAKMTPTSYRKGCPVTPADLSHVKVRYFGFDGQSHWGDLIVATDQAQNVALAFKTIYEARFPIKSMKLVDEYGGVDEKSMAANNTSGFNCRPVAGTSRWSGHSYGRAIDINPVQNPYIRGSLIEPFAGRKFADLDRSRTDLPKGVIGENSVVVKALSAIGWEWGDGFGDYQHFAYGGG